MYLALSLEDKVVQKLTFCLLPVSEKENKKLVELKSLFWFNHERLFPQLFEIEKCLARQGDAVRV